MWIPQNFLYTRSCHLQIQIVLLLPFQSGWLFISFSCPNALVLTSSPVFNTSGETGQPFPVPNVRRKDSDFSIKYDDSHGFLINVFYQVEKFPSIPNLLGFLFFCLCHERVLKFVKWFFCVYWDDYMGFLLQYFNMVYCIDWFSYAEWISNPWDKSHLVIVNNITLSVSYWIHFASILLRIFVFILKWDIGL